MTTPDLNLEDRCAKVQAWFAVQRIWRGRAEVEACRAMDNSLVEFIQRYSTNDSQATGNALDNKQGDLNVLS